MTSLTLDLQGGSVLTPQDGIQQDTLSIANGQIQAARTGRSVRLDGYLLLPGIVDCHGDAFERHLAPRRGAMPDMVEGVIATEAELAANGITTAVLAQFHSWEGGLRGPDYAARVFKAIKAARSDLATDLIPQLRFETHMLDDFDDLPDRMAEWDVSYLVFNDHLPHDRLASGRKPPRLTGQALKAGRNPDDHLAMMKRLHARSANVPAALETLADRLAKRGIKMGSHDDRTARQRECWRRLKVRVSEFPETQEAAHEARSHNEPVIMGAPNVVRGNSHNGNISATELVRQGLCTALASDYHYPSLRRAAFTLITQGTCDLSTAWSLLSKGPAELLGLEDRGTLEPGRRADLTILNAENHRVVATLAAGRVTYLSGSIANRFFT